jgi:hypothetical protein
VAAIKEHSPPQKIRTSPNDFLSLNKFGHEGRERSWGLGFGSFFFVFGCLFCVSVNLPVFWLHNLVLHKPLVRCQNSK